LRFLLFDFVRRLEAGLHRSNSAWDRRSGGH
jgi:hypothetical protein